MRRSTQAKRNTNADIVTKHLPRKVVDPCMRRGMLTRRLSSANFVKQCFTPRLLVEAMRELTQVKNPSHVSIVKCVSLKSLNWPDIWYPTLVISHFTVHFVHYPTVFHLSPFSYGFNFFIRRCCFSLNRQQLTRCLSIRMVTLGCFGFSCVKLTNQL